MKRCWLCIVVALMFSGSACNRDPEVAKRKYLESGNRYFEKGKFNEASIMYRSALKKDAVYAEAYYRLGLTFLKTNNYASAERSLRRAFSLLKQKGDKGPQFQDTVSKLSDVYLIAYMTDSRREKAYEDAYRQFKDELEEGSFDRHRLEGYLAWRSGEPDKALEHFEAARKIRPAEPNLALAAAQVLIAKSRFEDAERILKDLIARDKTTGAAYDVLYRLYLQRNLTAEAEQVRRLKSESNPSNLDYRLQLAAHYYAMNKRDLADGIVNGVISDTKSFPRGRERAGDFYMNFREFDKAIATYRGGLGGTKEEKLNFQRKIVDVLMLQGKNDQALSLLDREVLKDNPTDPVGTALRATLWLEMGNRNQLGQAISELETAVSKLPRNAVVRYNLGRAYWAKGNMDMARAQFRSASEIQPDYLAPRLGLVQIQMNRGEYAQALQASEEIVRLSPGNLSARLLRSMALQGIGKVQEARAELQMVLKARPESAEAQFRLGLLEMNAKDFKAAEKVFSQCLAEGIGAVVCQVGLAEVYTAQEQYDKAVSLLETELKKTPDRRELHLATANTNVLAKRYDAAVSLYKKMIEKEPDSSDLHLRLGETYRRMGKTTEAIESFRRVKQLQPGHADAAIWLALLLHQSGREADAKVEYQQILARQSDNAVALNNLAYVIAEQGGDLDMALTYAQRAKQKVPNNPEIADTLGWIYIRKGLRREALDIYRDLVKKVPENPTFRYHFAMALFQQGDKPQAKKELESALRGKPSRDEEGRIRELLQKIG